MAGVMSLMQGPQGQQGPMPGQAQQQPMPGMMPQQGAATPGAMTGSLKAMNLDQLKMLYQNPQAGSPPLWAVISALAEKQKEAQAMQAAQGQQAMAQNAQMQQQPPVAAQVVQAADQMQQEPVMAAHGGIMHGYAGGGAVSFKYAGYVPPREEGESFEDYRQRVMRFQEQKLAEEKTEARRKTQEYYAGELAARKGLARPSPFTGQGQQVDASKLFPFGPPESPMMDVPEIQVAHAPAPMQPTRRPPANNKPPAMSQGLGGLMSGVEQTGTPGPDTLSDIESKGIAANKAYQDVLRQQGTVDPRLAELREAAYKSSQGIAERRERDRLAALEAAQKQYADPTDLLIGLAGGAGGRTALDVLRGAVSGAGAARTTKRAELQKAQEVSRQEQNAIDTLNQALAEKRVADMTGDVNQRREADRKVAEAELKVTDLRSGIQKERATEQDRAEQRRLTERGQNVQQQTAREQIAAQLQSAKIGAAAREGKEGLAEQRLALQAMRADPNYAAIVKELTEAKKLAGVSTSPTLQTRLRAAEKAARDLASSYGVTPGMMGMGGAGAPAPAGDATTRLRFDAQGNPIK